MLQHVEHALCSLQLRLQRNILLIDCTGAPNDSFLSDPLKCYFKLSGVSLKLCRFILARAIIFLSVRSL